MQQRDSGALRPEADADLIARAKHDRRAFGEIYDLYLHRMYAFCVTRCSTREEAEDLTAQTFERALAGIGRYDDRGLPLSSWLLRIAANGAANQARGRKSVGPPRDSELSTEDPLGAEQQPSADHWVEQWELTVWLRGHLGTLPPDQQRAVHLRFFEDRAFRDVAEHMERSEDAARQLLQRALATLRARIQAESLSDV